MAAEGCLFQFFFFFFSVFSHVTAARIVNMGATTLQSGHAMLNVSFGETLEDSITGDAGTCKSFASLGRQITTTTATYTPQTDTTLNVVSTAGYASSGYLSIRQNPWIFVDYSSITATTFEGLQIRSSQSPDETTPVPIGRTVQGTTDGSLVDATDIMFQPGNMPYGPTEIDTAWTAPENAVEPPASGIIFQVAMKGDGIQTIRGNVLVTVNSQIGKQVDFKHCNF